MQIKQENENRAQQELVQNREVDERQKTETLKIDVDKKKEQQKELELKVITSIINITE